MSGRRRRDIGVTTSQWGVIQNVDAAAVVGDDASRDARSPASKAAAHQQRIPQLHHEWPVRKRI
jgi:hypothetical protein